MLNAKKEYILEVRSDEKLSYKRAEQFLLKTALNLNIFPYSNGKNGFIFKSFNSTDIEVLKHKVSESDFNLSIV